MKIIYNGIGIEKVQLVYPKRKIASLNATFDEEVLEGEVFEYKAGEIVFMHGLTVHCGMPGDGSTTISHRLFAYIASEGVKIDDIFTVGDQDFPTWKQFDPCNDAKLTGDCINTKLSCL